MEPDLSERFDSKLSELSSDLNNNPASSGRSADLGTKQSQTESDSRVRDQRSAYTLSLSLPNGHKHYRALPCIMNCGKDYLTKELSDVEIQRRLRNLVKIISNDQRIRNLDGKPNQLRINHHNLIEGNLCLHARNQPTVNSESSSASSHQTIDNSKASDKTNKMNGKTSKKVNYPNNSNENDSVLHNRHRLSGGRDGRQSIERSEDNSAENNSKENDSDETVRRSKAAQQFRVTNCKAQDALRAVDETDEVDNANRNDAVKFDHVNRMDVNRIDATKCHKSSNQRNRVTPSSTNRKQTNDRSPHFLKPDEEDQSSDLFVDLAICSECSDGLPKESFVNKFNKSTFLPTAQSMNAPKAASRDDFDSSNRSTAYNSTHNDTLNDALSGSITNIDAASTRTRSKLNEQRTNQPRKQTSRQSSGRIPPPRLVNSSGEIYIEHPGQNVVFSLYNSSIVRPSKAANQLTRPLAVSISDTTKRPFGHLIESDKAHLPNEDASTCARQPPGRKLDHQTTAPASVLILSHPAAWHNEQMPVPSPPHTRPPLDGSPDELAITELGECAQGGPQYQTASIGHSSSQDSSQNSGHFSKQTLPAQPDPYSASRPNYEQTSDAMQCNSNGAAVSNLAASNLTASTAVSCASTASDRCMQPAVSAAHVRGSSSETSENISAQASVSSHPTSARESCRSSERSNSSSIESFKLSAGSSVSAGGSTAVSCSGGLGSKTLKCARLKCLPSDEKPCAKCPSKCVESQMLSNPDCPSSRLSPSNVGNMSALSIERLIGTDEELIVENGRLSSCVQTSDSVRRDVKSDAQPDGQSDGQRDAQSDSPTGYHSDQMTYSNSDRQQIASSSDQADSNQQDESSAESSSTSSKQQLYINTNGLLHQNANGLTTHPHSSSIATNGLTSQLPPQQSPSATSSTASSLSLPVDMDSIDDGIHLNSVPEPKQSRDYRTHEEFVYAMKEDLAEWFNIMYDDLQLNVHNFMDQVGTGVIVCK